jgi:hypothetical protein
VSEVQLLPSWRISPLEPWRINDKILEEQRHRFEAYLHEVQRQEADGIVKANTIIETILAAWTLRSKLWCFNKDPDVHDLIAKISKVGETAKKYGYSQLWNAKMYGTLKTRLFKLQTKEGATLPLKHHCGRCGRVIWNPVSVKRGVGPVCYHKKGQ